jgi:hypothetical protein
MTETTSHNQHDDKAYVDDPERLMTRIIDSEADDADRRRFEQLAASDPSLWRKLAERQQDMLELSEDVASELAVAFQVNVDRAQANLAADLKENAASPLYRPLWWLGWAAAIMLAAAWVTVASLSPGTSDRPEISTLPALGAGDRLAPEQHLQRYLSSPFVVGELDPIMLKHEELDDSRIELRILRRIEEAYLLDRDDPLPIDADGRLIRDPAELQRRSIGAAEQQ